ncbi:MAG: response regulator [Patescibacteria group bacterium]
MIEVIKNNDQVILIVEDEGALSGVLQNKLTRHGFVVEVASDGIEGLEKMKTLQPKLVLLDLIMPNKNGFQVLEEAKADQNTKNIAIVIFSNLNQDEDRVRAKKLGAVDFWVKSDMAINDVVGKINEIVQHVKAE